MLVRGAQPQTWQSGLNLRAPGLGAHSWQGEKRHPYWGPRSGAPLSIGGPPTPPLGTTGPVRSPGASLGLRRNPFRKMPILRLAPPRPGHRSHGPTVLPILPTCVRWLLLCFWRRRATLACCCNAHRLELYFRIPCRWCHTAMGLVKMGLPLTPTTVLAPRRTNERHLAVMAGRRMDSAPTSLPRGWTLTWVNSSVQSSSERSCPTRKTIRAQEARLLLSHWTLA